MTFYTYSKDFDKHGQFHSYSILYIFKQKITINKIVNIFTTIIIKLIYEFIKSAPYQTMLVQHSTFPRMF